MVVLFPAPLGPKKPTTSPVSILKKFKQDMSIIVENLTKKYEEQKAVNDISFKIETGEVVGFLGPNGAGKSTTMKMITCFMAPSVGNITIDGISVNENQSLIKKKIGYLPENNPLYFDMSIVDYLRFSAEIQGVSGEDIPRRIGIIDIISLNVLKPTNLIGVFNFYPEIHFNIKLVSISAILQNNLILNINHIFTCLVHASSCTFRK
jgi:ABC-type glutathione transport system ATPase component